MLRSFKRQLNPI